MLRKRLPNLDFSPRLHATLSQSAEPLEITDATSILKEAAVQSSYDLGRIHAGSWYDTIRTIETRAGRNCTTAESGTLRTAIDALCSRSKFPPIALSDSAEQELADSQRQDHFFAYKKFCIQDFDDARASVRRVVNAFRNQSAFISTAAAAGNDTEDILKLIDASLRSSVRSPKTISLYAKHALTFYDFLRERGIPQNSWSGPASLLPLYQFFEQRAGSTVPATMKSALKTFAEVLHINWPLHERALTTVCAKPEREPKQAPMLKTFHIEFFEKRAVDKDHPFPERLYAANFALMCHASLRYDDTRTIETLSIGTSEITGKIAVPKTHHIDAQKFFCPAKGFTTEGWAAPIASYRQSYFNARSHYPTFLFPSTTENGQSILEPIAKKANILKVFRRMLTNAGETAASKFTLHSPRNWYTSAAAQLGWDIKAQTTLGRWGQNSAMPNRYNRQKGTVELSVRNDVVGRVHDGWQPVSEDARIDQPPPPRSAHALRADTAHHEVRERLALGNARVGG